MGYTYTKEYYIEKFGKRSDVVCLNSGMGSAAAYKVRWGKVWWKFSYLSKLKETAKANGFDFVLIHNYGNEIKEFKL